MITSCCSANGRVSSGKELPRPPSLVAVVRPGEKEAEGTVLEGRGKMDMKMEHHLITSKMLILNLRHLMTAQLKKSQV